MPKTDAQIEAKAREALVNVPKGEWVSGDAAYLRGYLEGAREFWKTGVEAAADDVRELRRRLARALWAAHAMGRTGNTRAFYTNMLNQERIELYPAAAKYLLSDGKGPGEANGP